TPLLDNSDNLPACSAVEALERQEPFINQTLAYHALAMLARLFRHGEISYHGGFINVARGQMSSLSIRRYDRCSLNSSRHDVLKSGTEQGEPLAWGLLRRPRRSPQRFSPITLTDCGSESANEEKQ